MADFLEKTIKPYLDEHGRRLFMTAGVDRWGMVKSFEEWDYQAVYGDLYLTLGIPIPIRSVASLKRLAALLIPVVSRLPFKWVYPVGESQEKRTPKAVEHFRAATVIAGDSHYITRYMPDELPGKVVVTNTTTEADVKLLKRRRCKVPGDLDTRAGWALLWNQHDGSGAGGCQWSGRACRLPACDRISHGSRGILEKAET